MNKLIKPAYEPQWHLQLQDFLDEDQSDPWKKLTSNDNDAIKQRYLTHLIGEAEYTLKWFEVDKNKWRKVVAIVTPLGVNFNAHPKDLKNPMFLSEKKSLKHLKVIPFEAASLACAANFILHNSKIPNIELVWLKLGQLQESLNAAFTYNSIFKTRQSANSRKKLTKSQMLIPILKELLLQKTTNKDLIPWFMDNLNRSLVGGIAIKKATIDQITFIKNNMEISINSASLLSLYSKLKKSKK